MSARDALVDILRVPPSQEESAVLATLRGRYTGERLYRECCDYLTGRTRHAAARIVATGRQPDAYIHVVDSHDAITCTYASDWIALYTSDPEPRPHVDVRRARDGEEPATFRVDAGRLTAVDAPQWLRNAVRAAFLRVEEFESDWLTMTGSERDDYMAGAMALASRYRGE